MSSANDLSGVVQTGKPRRANRLLDGLVRKVQKPESRIASRFFGQISRHFGYGDFRFLDLSRPAGRGGTASISGQVLAQGTPVQRRVHLYNQLSGELIAKATSDADGNYTFKNLVPNSVFMAVAIDHTGTFEFVIQDNLVPQELAGA